MDKPPTGHNRRPWTFSTRGYLEVLFTDSDEARRAYADLQERGVPAADMRLYVAEEILRNEAHLLEGQSWLAKLVDALSADHQARRRDLANAQAGGAALWLYAPTRHDANRLLRFLADSLAVPRSRLVIASGASGRRKRVVIVGLAPDELEMRLQAALSR